MVVPAGRGTRAAQHDACQVGWPLRRPTGVGGWAHRAGGGAFTQVLNRRAVKKVRLQMLVRDDNKLWHGHSAFGFECPMPSRMPQACCRLVPGFPPGFSTAPVTTCMHFWAGGGAHVTLVSVTPAWPAMACSNSSDSSSKSKSGRRTVLRGEQSIDGDARAGEKRARAPTLASAWWVVSPLRQASTRPQPRGRRVASWTRRGTGRVPGAC